MRIISVPIFLSFLLLAACAAQTGQGPSAELVAKATAGDGRAQLDMAMATCDTHGGVYEADAVTPLRWWKRAAKNKDPKISYEALQQLGEYYLASYAFDGFYTKDGEKTQAPDTYKQVAKCRGEKPVKRDFPRAIAAFRQCAMTQPDMRLVELLPSMCRSGLGHAYYLQKNYAEALFWRLTVVVNNDIAMKPDWKSWLAGMKGYEDMLHPDRRDDDYARIAAAHLTPKQRTAVFNGVRAYLSTEMTEWEKDWKAEKR